MSIFSREQSSSAIFDPLEIDSTPRSTVGHDLLTLHVIVVAEGACFHCGAPTPFGGAFSSEILSRERTFCCRGCASVANAIVSSGLAEFYRKRTRMSPRAKLIPDE